MRETILTILGFNLKFQFTVFDGNYIEWNLTPEDRKASPLFEILLRIHYGKYIEDQLRETWFRQEHDNSLVHTLYDSVDDDDDTKMPF